MPTLRTISNRHMNRRVLRAAPLSAREVTPIDTGQIAAEAERFEQYRFDPVSYIRNKLLWDPWSGGENTGQQEVLDHYVLALRKQFEQRAFEQGLLKEEDLLFWRPGEMIENSIMIEAGHTVGKTKLFSGIVNHFYDCFAPSIIYCFAPGFDQIHDLLFKEIKTDRRDKDLPGRILDLELKIAADHFVKGRATDNSHGKGSEKVQGQHGGYWMFVLDEAEGVADYVFTAIKSMTSGGIGIVLMAANPRTRISLFHKQRELPDVKHFRISCLNHPNVTEGRDVVPSAVRRDYVLNMIASDCEPVEAHDVDTHTFEVPYPVQKDGQTYPPVTIWQPNNEFMFRVLGIAPANSSDNTFVPAGRYEAATKRREKNVGSEIRIGVDVSRWGNDFGTIYVRRGNWIWRHAKISRQDTVAYVAAIREAAMKEFRTGARSLQIRVDGGGGFGGGVIDQIKHDPELKKAFPDFVTFEVDFGGTAKNEKAYHFFITELYAEAAETLKGLCLLKAAKELEVDLTERLYKWVNAKGIAVKQLEPKDDFRARVGRSPDDGDGLVLAAGPDYLFKKRVWTYG